MEEPMKKLYPYFNFIVAGFGIAGALLRMWLLSAGTDARGLYPANHPGWIGYLILIGREDFGIEPRSVLRSME